MTINPFMQTYTVGALDFGKSKGIIGDIMDAVVKTFYSMPDHCYDGGNDKEFFSITLKDTKLFVAANELNGLTVMLPDEY